MQFLLPTEAHCGAFNSHVPMRQSGPMLMLMRAAAAGPVVRSRLCQRAPAFPKENPKRLPEPFRSHLIPTYAPRLLPRSPAPLPPPPSSP